MEKKEKKWKYKRLVVLDVLMMSGERENVVCLTNCSLIKEHDSKTLIKDIQRACRALNKNYIPGEYRIIQVLEY